MTAQARPIATPPLTRLAVPAAWRKAFALALRRLAEYLDAGAPAVKSLASPPVTEAQSGATSAPGSVFRSYRADVREWIAGMPPALRLRLGDALEAGAFEVMLHRVPYLPEPASVDALLDRVPDWRMLHPCFSSALLRRLVAWRHNAQAIDEDAFAIVALWFEQRSREALRVAPWPETVRHARQALGQCSNAPALAAGASLRSGDQGTSRPVMHQVARRMDEQRQRSAKPNGADVVPHHGAASRSLGAAAGTTVLARPA
jgi:hypothetical protein